MLILEGDGNIELVSVLVNSELNKVADWFAVNNLSLNEQKKIKLMLYHYHQRVKAENEILHLMINNTLNERVKEIIFFNIKCERICGL